MGVRGGFRTIAGWVALSALFALVAVAIGRIRYDAQGRDLDTAIAQLRARFEQSDRPVAIVDLQKVFPRGNPGEWLDPSRVLPQTHRFDWAEVSRLARYANSCDGEVRLSHKADPELAKAWTWARYECGAIDALPEGFFETAPFFHPSGPSYAFLWASKLGLGSPEAVAWTKAHPELFHLSEFERVNLVPEGQRAQIASLGPRIWAELADRSAMALSKDLVWVQKGRTGAFGQSWEYSAHDRVRWEAALRRGGFRTRVAPTAGDAGCAFREGNLCLVSDSLPREARARNLKWMFFGLSFATLVLGVRLTWVLLRERRNSDQRRRFILQTLAHELRTPLASMVLTLDRMKGALDALPGDAQADVLKLGDEVERLRRLAETSRQYLRSEGGGALIRPKAEVVTSMRDLVEAYSDPWRATVEVDCPEDFGIVGDRYWLGLCVKNLVENAHLHGKSPVRVEVRRLKRGHVVEIAVTDGGDLKKRDIRRAEGSGLAIVAQVAHELGGRLKISRRPTRFTIQLKGATRDSAFVSRRRSWLGGVAQPNASS